MEAEITEKTEKTGNLKRDKTTIN